MKTTKYLLVAAAAAVTLTLNAQAGESLLSPRSKALADSLRKVPTVASDAKHATNRAIGNARARELAHSFRTVAGSAPSIDLAHAARPALSPKDPRFEAAWRENALKKFRIAPLK